MNELNDVYANFVVELRRGVTNLVVLNQCQQPTYGYQLVKELADSGIPLSPGSCTSAPEGRAAFSSSAAFHFAAALCAAIAPAAAPRHPAP